MADCADVSLGSVRHAVRVLPSERRRELARAVRDGRAVSDPRDAALAVAWARQIQATWWPGWLLPRTRPHGRRALLWLLHAAWTFGTSLTFLAFLLWKSGGVFHWLALALFAYSILSIPQWYKLTLRTRWNAPEAERQNRELLG